MERKVKAALASILVNMGLVCLKAVAAFFSGSLAILADAWHSSTDIVVSLLILVGFKVSKRRLHKSVAIIENVLALVVACLIIATAYGVGRKVFAGTVQIKLHAVAIPLTLVCIAISYFLSRYKIRVGRETDSPSLTADGYHSRADMFSSAAVLVSLVGDMINLKVDRAVALIVALLIGKLGLELLASAVRGLAAGRLLDFSNLNAMLRSTAMGKRTLEFLGGIWRKAKDAFSSHFGQLRLWIWRRRRQTAGCALVLALFIYVGSGFYRVFPDEVAVLLRFGRIVAREVPPGLHYHLPWPISQVRKVRTHLMRRVELGFRTKPEAITGRGQIDEPWAYLWESMHREGRYEKRLEEALMFTGDENLIDLNLVVQYRAVDPAQYLFRARDVENIIRCLAEAAARQAASKNRAEDLVAAGRPRLEKIVKDTLRKMLSAHDYNMGVSVEKILLQDVHPPVEVVPAFRDVASAREEKARTINEAESYRNDKLPKTLGSAAEALEEAQAYRADKVLRSRGDAVRFAAMATEFRTAPRVHRLRMYLEGMESALVPVEKLIVSHSLKRLQKNVGDSFLLGRFLYESLRLQGEMTSQAQAKESEAIKKMLTDQAQLLEGIEEEIPELFDALEELQSAVEENIE